MTTQKQAHLYLLFSLKPKYYKNKHFHTWIWFKTHVSFQYFSQNPRSEVCEKPPTFHSTHLFTFIDCINSTTVYNFSFFFPFQRKHYVKYAKVFPLSTLLDFRVPSKWYRRMIGGSEVLCGALLAGFPNRKLIEFYLWK